MQVSIYPLDTQPDNVTLFAKSELIQYLTKAKSTDKAPQDITLAIVEPSDTGLPSHSVYDGYSITWPQSHLELRAASPKGLLNGVYDILRLVGFAFPFPGVDRYPSKQNWSAVKANASGQWQVPSFRHRILHFDNMRLTSEMIDWIGKLKINMLQQPLHVYKVDLDANPNLVEMIKDRGIEMNIGCHGFDNWLPPSKYGKQHPQWYAQKHVVHKGVLTDPNDALNPDEFSGGQICLSNLDVIQEFAKNVIAYLKEHPEVGTISLWPNDGIAGWCTCEKCLALEPEPDRPDPQTGTPSRITSYLWFIQQIGKLVQDQVADARIEFGAFYDFATPPQDTRVVPQGDRYLGFLVDDYFGCLLHGHGENCNRPRIEQAHRQWREVFPDEIYAIGYYSDLHKIMDFPIVYTTKIKEDFAYLKDEIGIDSVMTLVVCADLDYLLDFCFQNVYSFATLGWDHRLQSEDVLGELAKGISPTSSDDVLQYLSVLDRLGRANPDKHAGWIWIRRDKSQFANWGHLASQVAIAEIISSEMLSNMKDRINRAADKAHSDQIALDILGRMQRAFRNLELMLSYDLEAPAEGQMGLLDEIAQAVAGRGKFPSSVVPALESIRKQAKH